MVAAGKQVEAADAGVADVQARKPVAQRHGVVGVELIIHTRADGEPALRRPGHVREGIDDAQRRRIERDSVDDRSVVYRMPLHVEIEGRLLVDRAAQGAAVFLQ